MKEISMANGKWSYRGYTCWIEVDYEEDNMKNWHYYTEPGSDVVKLMPLSPYVAEDAMRAWIREGCPKHPSCVGNFTLIHGRLVA